jgi:hypothetical protein
VGNSGSRGKRLGFCRPLPFFVAAAFRPAERLFVFVFVVAGLQSGAWSEESTLEKSTERLFQIFE